MILWENKRTNGNIIAGGKWGSVTENDELKRWSEYSEGLLNVYADRVADVGCFGEQGM